MAAVSTAQRGSQAGSESQRTAPVQSRRPVFLPQSGYAGWQWRKYPSRLTKLAQVVRHFTEERFLAGIAILLAGNDDGRRRPGRPQGSLLLIKTNSHRHAAPDAPIQDWNQWSPYPWRPACCWHSLRQPPHYQPCPSAHYYCQAG